MTGYVGPYVSIDGPDVWVPRVVPYLEARRIAQEANQDGDRLVYQGKGDAELVGFARDCMCEEICYGGPKDEYGDPGPDPECTVPAWHFTLEER